MDELISETTMAATILLHGKPSKAKYAPYRCFQIQYEYICTHGLAPGTAGKADFSSNLMIQVKATGCTV